MARGRARAIYQIWENGVVIAEGTARDLGEQLNVTQNRIRVSCYEGWRLLRKYRVTKKGATPDKDVDKTRYTRSSLTGSGTWRGGSPGHPIPFDQMSPLSQDAYVARQHGLSYGHYWGGRR